MTDVLEPALRTPEAERAFAEMLRREELFDATRPPCPTDWCDGACTTTGHTGDAVIHASTEADIPTTSASKDGGKGSAGIRASRYDALDHKTESLVEISFASALGLFEDSAQFTPVQARQFAAALVRHANLLEPEQDLPAQQVRVGDWFPVGGEWLYVYGVCVDEPSNIVQVFTTVERGEWPELDGDEQPHSFPIGDTVRVRREAHR